MSNAATVARLYEAFGRGDIPAILAELPEDVEWNQWPNNYGQKAGIPWMAHRQGREEVLGFFKILGEWDFKSFEVVTLMEGGDKVAAHIQFLAVLPNGFTLDVDELHLWTFNPDGTVAAFRHDSDTAKLIAAWKG